MVSLSPGTTPLTFNSYIKNLAVLAVINIETVSGTTRSVDPNFNQIIPQMLNYAELRIQRDLDLLPAQGTILYTIPAGSGQLRVPVNDFVTVQNAALVTNSGNKSTLLIPTTKEFTSTVYPDASATGTPKYIAPYGSSDEGNTDIVYAVVPVSASPVLVAVTGTMRMLTLNQYAGTPQADTATTFISALLPDLLLMASMIYISGYQRNFSAASDDPSMAVNYEKQYQTLLKSAMVEEARRRWRASAWSAEAPAPVATPVRA